MNSNIAILQDYERALHRRRQSAIASLTNPLLKWTNTVRKTILRMLDRPVGNSLPARPPMERFARQLQRKNARQLIRMLAREREEVAAERRRFKKNWPKIQSGELATTLPALQFLESRERAIRYQLAVRGMI